MSKTPKIIAITGGSGAGKTWLADRLLRNLGPSAARLSLDDFYLDQSHLTRSRRSVVNYDHPGAIDWERVESVLRGCRAGQTVSVPHYNFATHTRLPFQTSWTPEPFVLMDGLWLLMDPKIRALIDLGVFLDCPSQLRLERRLARDVAERGRTADSVRGQFWRTVAPMHDQFVAPQAQCADVLMTQPSSDAEIVDLTAMIRSLGGEADLDNSSVVHRSRYPEFVMSDVARRVWSGQLLAPSEAMIAGFHTGSPDSGLSDLGKGSSISN